MSEGEGAVAIDDDTKAAANPTKGFFVRMITRDISLEDCILDLIDNSVDGAWRSEGSRPMGLADDADLSKYSIWINTSPEHFSIKDNCGGMTLDDAVNHAFSFGRHAIDELDEYSIGVYGIGMKRAVFKLGTDIRIRSTYQEEDGNTQSFAVPIIVADWLADDDPPWDFDIVEDGALDEKGVEIIIDALTPVAATSFGSPAFVRNLGRVIARDYSLHLNRGLNIFVDDVPVAGWQIELRQSDEFVPMRIDYKDELDGDEVAVEIIGGMSAPPPEIIDPDDDDDESGDKRFGWYVACNGRIVLVADKTEISGWGTNDWPQWHSQYSGFIGIILFTAPKATSLPLTTTKRSVDISSEIFRRARPRMREVSKQWIAYTNARKQALEEAKQKEAAAAVVSIFAVAPHDSAKLPTLAVPQAERVSHINYSVPTTKMKKLAKELGRINMTNREVGLRSFDYAYKDMVGDE